MTDNGKYRYVPCGVCGGKRSRVVFQPRKKKERSPILRYSATSIVMADERIVKCSACGFIFVNPRLSRETIWYGYALSDADEYVSESRGRTRTASESFAFVKKYVSSGILLDVGCGAGFFLREAGKHGWKTYGIETNKKLASCARREHISVRVGTIEKSRLPHGRYDVITLWDVIEHMDEPRKVMQSLHSALKKNGYLFISTPDVGSVWARLFGRNWWFYLAVHLSYFNRTSITRLLRNTGFRPIRIERCYQTLSVAYLVHRLKPWKKIYKMIGWAVRLTGMNDTLFRYYAGQMRIVAQKI